jgi:hypothetical protein
MTDRKKRGKISTAAKTRSGLVGFATRWAGNIHKAFAGLTDQPEKPAARMVTERAGELIFQVKNDIAKLVVQCTQLLPVV